MCLKRYNHRQRTGSADVENQTTFFMKISQEVVSHTTQQGNSSSSGGHPATSSSGNIPSVTAESVTEAGEEAESLVTEDDESVNFRLQK